MASRLLRDDKGATFLEFTVVLPLLIIVSLGLVDLGLLMFGWGDATRAVQAGARAAATSSPVASGIGGRVTASGSQTSGTYCVSGGVYTNCTLAPTYQCKGVDGLCKAISGSGPDLTIVPANLQLIVNKMNAFSRTLSPSQVIITYTPLPLGYVGQPTMPMNVTVSLYCVGQPLFFVGGLLKWALPGCKDNSNNNINGSDGIRLNVSATLPGEDLTTN